MEKIYLVYIRKNGYTTQVIPCASKEVAKRVLAGERTNIIAAWASMSKDSAITKNDDEHFKIVEKFTDDSYELSIDCLDIIK